MMHTTLGLDIGTRRIKYALCQVDGQRLSIKTAGSVPIPENSELLKKNKDEEDI